MAAVPIAKTDEPRGLVYGWANVIATPDGTPVVDHQGDIIEEAELDKAAVDFMLHHRASGEMHDGDANGVIVESFLASPTKLAAMGIEPELAKRMPTGLWVGVKVPPTVFAKVKDGTYKAFSIQGGAQRVAVEG